MNRRSVVSHKRSQPRSIRIGAGVVPIVSAVGFCARNRHLGLRSVRVKA